MDSQLHVMSCVNSIVACARALLVKYQSELCLRYLSTKNKSGR